MRSVAEAHAAVADFLGAGSPEEIKFGYNMSTLTLAIGRSIGATLGPGDEIVVTTLDHEANVSTWKAMAADRGVTVQQVDIHEDDVTLDLEDLESKLGPRTKLVAVGYASNAVGTVNPVREIVARAHEVGALTYVDAVAYAPHGPIDVRALDTDFLVTSVYKWFGPHLGALYGKAEVLDRLPVFKVRPAHDRFETGTQSFESIAGTLAATDYLRDVGRAYGDVTGAAGAADAQRAPARARGRDDRHRRLRTRAGDPIDRWPARDPRRRGPRDHRPGPLRAPRADGLGVHRRRPSASRGRGARSRWASTCGTATSTRPGSSSDSARPTPAASFASGSSTTTPRTRSTARSRRWSGSRRPDRMTRSSIQARLARGFDPAELRRIKRLWVRHSIAEDRRDIDGLVATLAPLCVYEIVPTGQRWEGHDGARAFYTELFGAFPDNAFALTEIVVGPQGVFEVATLTGTNQGPWAGAPAVGPTGPARGPDPVSLGPRHGTVPRGADLVRPRRHLTIADVPRSEGRFARSARATHHGVPGRRVIGHPMGTHPR